MREPWCPALISVVCLFLFVTSRSTWMFLPWNLLSFDTLNFPILLCEKRYIIHLFIQQCLLLLLQNYPFHFAEYHCLVHFLFFILLKSLLFIFTSCPIFILLSIFPTLMAPLIFSRLSFNFFPSKFNLS